MTIFWVWFAVGLSGVAVGLLIVHGMILAELRHRIRTLEHLIAPTTNPFGWMGDRGQAGREMTQKERDLFMGQEVARRDKGDPGDFLGPADHG